MTLFESFRGHLVPPPNRQQQSSHADPSAAGGGGVHDDAEVTPARGAMNRRLP
jgi:hypothetical protein